ncbi:MAG: SAM hydrolase/SAM-dependent halogenase family protein [Candidatus Brocadiales bacterium]
MTKRPVITLLTDFGTKDSYVGIMKGVISGINPNANIIDLCHEIGPQDVFGGAYVLYSSYKFFPEGTIHVAVVDPGVGTERKIICVKTRDYLFLAPDNGILSLVLTDEKPQLITEVTNQKYFLPEISNTFHGRDIFAPVAAHLSKGTNPLKLGKELTKFKEIELPVPNHSKQGVLKGEVIYIDVFGNLITNIKQDVFLKLVGAIHELPLPEDVFIVAGKKRIRGISRSYADAPVGEAVAIFGSSGYLEISVNLGNAHNVLGLKKGDTVIVSYKI